MSDTVISFIITFFLGGLVFGTASYLGATRDGIREGRCLERGGQIVDGKCAKVEVMP